MHPLFGDLICNDLRIGIAGKMSPLINQRITYLIYIYYVPIMSKCDSALCVIDKNRLGIFPGTASRGRIPDMAYSYVSLKLLQYLTVEHLAHKSHIFVCTNVADRTAGITDYYSRRLLPPVLKSCQSVVNILSGINIIAAVYSENTAFLMYPVVIFRFPHHRLLFFQIYRKKEKKRPG